MNELALFAGAGGGLQSSEMLGWRTVCAVEWEPYPASVLCARQNDGLLPTFPIWDDVQTFDGKPWRGIVDVVSGGFPCQDISVAGKGVGITGERSGMWGHFARIIGEVRPRYAFIENSPALTNRGLGTVLRDLAAMGYDAEWGVLGAGDVGAPHKRDRIWILGHTNSHSKSVGAKHDETPRLPELATNSAMPRQQENGPKRNEQEISMLGGDSHVSSANSTQLQGNECAQRIAKEHTDTSCTSWWEVEPDVGRVANGVEFGMDRLKSIGNGQVPQCAAEAFRRLRGNL
jgi:DNA (cytosine-5)-methyltransferase 1